MNWLNIPTTVIRSPQYVGSEPIPRATWLNLMAYCAEQENSGRIEGAKLWKDRQWQQTCGVTLSEASSETDLWAWEGDDLILWGYPEDAEEVVAAKRKGGAVGGKRRAANAAATRNSEDASRTPSSIPSGSPETPSRTPSTKDKIRQGKEREGNVRENAQPEPPLSILFDASVLPDPPPEMSPSMPKRELRPLQKIQARLSELWPSAAKAMTGAEMHELHESLGVLDELTDEDWTACKAWNDAPLRELDRVKRWPRDRSEFVRHAGQAVEQVRDWWKRRGRRWHQNVQGAAATPKSVSPQPKQEPGDPDALAAFLGAKFDLSKPTTPE